MDENPYAPPTARDQPPDRHPVRDNLRFGGLMLIGSGLTMAAVGLLILTVDQWRSPHQFHEGRWYPQALFLAGNVVAWMGKVVRDVATPGAWREPADGSLRVPTSVGFLLIVLSIVAGLIAFSLRRG